LDLVEHRTSDMLSLHMSNNSEALEMLDAMRPVDSVEDVDLFASHGSW